MIRAESGYTLMEALIVTAIVAMVTAAIFPLLYQGQQSYQGEKEFAEVTQQARIAMDQITRYLRQAGNDPLEVLTTSPIQTLSSGHILISSDITGSVPSTTNDPKESTGDPDGTLNSIYESLEVRYDGSSRTLYIDVGYGEEILAENISSFQLSYFDKSGASTTNDAEIARIKVEMVAETGEKDPRTGKISSMTLVSDVFVRNKSYQLFE
ncbi:MAG: type II secretion system protein [Acidobacteria bacterium]|nr:type II secretion system protein [Acidobacteriota bacterium]